MRLPGFIDSHIHFLGLGYISYNVDLTSSSSITDIMSKLKESKQQGIIIGRGFNQEDLIEKRLPTKEDLNQVSNDIPIMIVRVCGHVIVVNDKMLELANIDNITKQVEGGTFSYETGVFTENALGLIYDKIPKPSIDDLRKYLITANKILLENGITQVASDDFCIFAIDYEVVMDTINQLYKENLIQVKITEQVNLPIDKLRDFISKGYINKSYGKYRMGPLKILADGSLGGRTAYLKEPYQDDPNNYGVRTYTDDELFELVHLADKNNMDVVIHAIGDSASKQAIDAIVKSLEITKRVNHNHAIIHAQLTNQEQILEMSKHEIGAIIQPIFLNSDIPIIESRIGNRAKDSYLFKTMYNFGVNVGFSTDCPIEPINPFYNIYSAITRRSIKHTNSPCFNENEGFTIEESLKCYTVNNHRYVYQETISNDYIIIDKDINNIKNKDLLDIKVLDTYIDGKLVYRRD